MILQQGKKSKSHGLNLQECASFMPFKCYIQDEKSGILQT